MSAANDKRPFISIWFGNFFEPFYSDREAFVIEEEQIEFDCIQWREEVIPYGWSTVAFRGGKAIGKYIQSGKTAIAQTNLESGKVFSFGFHYSYSCSRPSLEDREAIAWKCFGQAKAILGRCFHINRFAQK